MTDKSHGGARKGSGRKPKQPTTTINFRVPVDKVPYLKPLVSTYIKGLLNANEQPIAPEIVKPDTEVVLPRKTDVKAKKHLFKNEVKGEPTMAELLKQSLKENNQGL